METAAKAKEAALTRTQHKVILELAKCLAFTSAGIVNIPLVTQWAKKIHIMDKDAIRVDNTRVCIVTAGDSAKYAASWTVITMQTFCAVLILELNPAVHQLGDPDAKIRINNALINTVENKLDGYGRNGVLFDRIHPTETTVEADIIMDAIHMYREHARNKGFVLSSSHLAEVWSASIRGLWKCRYEPDLCSFNGMAAQHVAGTTTNESERWTHITIAMANAIVERMIVAIVSIRYGLNFKLGGMEIKDTISGPFAQMVIGGEDPKLDIMSYVLNRQCVLRVTERHILTLDEPSGRMPAILNKASVAILAARDSETLAIDGTATEDPDFLQPSIGAPSSAAAAPASSSN